MSFLHHVTNRHYIHVFPNDRLLDEVQASFECFFMSGPKEACASTCLEKDFDREALKSKENCVIFWRELPGWLPVKTEAKVALHYLGQNPTSIPVSDLPPRKAEIARNFMRTFRRADLLFSNMSSSSLDIHHRLLIPPYSNEYGIPVFGLKEWDVVVYGALEGSRRKEIVGSLKNMFGRRFHCLDSSFTGHPSYLKSFLDRSNFVYHVQEDPSMSLNPIRILQTAASSAALVYDGGDTWPLDGFENSAMKVGSDLELTAHRLKEQIESSSARCQRFRRQISSYNAGYYMNDCIKAFRDI